MTNKRLDINIDECELKFFEHEVNNIGRYIEAFSRLFKVSVL